MFILALILSILCFACTCLTLILFIAKKREKEEHSAKVFKQVLILTILFYIYSIFFYMFTNSNKAFFKGIADSKILYIDYFLNKDVISDFIVYFIICLLISNVFYRLGNRKF